jgi:hypothetical protein
MAVLVVATLVVVALGFAMAGRFANLPTVPEPSGRPPPPEGYFSTLPAGAWDELPGDRRCARAVSRSGWEPRPDNYAPNHHVPDRRRVARALAARPRSREGAYSPLWDRWLLPRVSGQFAGTTDEVLQWAACKWGIADNILRAVAMRESGWHQFQVYADGGCVISAGCGDLLLGPQRGRRSYCAAVALHFPRYARHEIRRECPRTFSIVGVMSWQDPRWGEMRGNQNGTFPFNMRSTAFAVDYYGSFLRGCLEGWVRWLGNTGSYRPGDLEGCLGAWYAGAWRSPEALAYAGRVLSEERQRSWLDQDWARQPLPCTTDRGCPRAGP